MRFSVALQALLFISGFFLFAVALTGLKETWGFILELEQNRFVLPELLNHIIGRPWLGLFAGVLLSSLLQSSSTAIALIVVTVASGVLSVHSSVYVIFGANIGTSATNALVALSHGVNRDEFKRVVPAAIIDDVYKVFNIGLFFMLEMTTGGLTALGDCFFKFWRISLSSSDSSGAASFLERMTLPFVELYFTAVHNLAGRGSAAALLLFILTLLLAHSGLRLLSSAIRSILSLYQDSVVKAEFLKRNWHAFGTGFGICWVVQSSSLAVSSILPFVAHKLVNLNSVYFYSLGAALATTCDPTQILSYARFGSVGLNVGFYHIVLNLIGALMFTISSSLTRLVISIAIYLGGKISESSLGPARLILYVGAFFYLIPIFFIYFLR